MRGLEQLASQPPNVLSGWGDKFPRAHIIGTCLPVRDTQTVHNTSSMKLPLLFSSSLIAAHGYPPTLLQFLNFAVRDTGHPPTSGYLSFTWEAARLPRVFLLHARVTEVDHLYFPSQTATYNFVLEGAGESSPTGTHNPHPQYVLIPTKGSSTSFLLNVLCLDPIMPDLVFTPDGTHFGNPAFSPPNGPASSVFFRSRILCSLYPFSSGLPVTILFYAESPEAPPLL